MCILYLEKPNELHPSDREREALLLLQEVLKALHLTYRVPGTAMCYRKPTRDGHSDTVYILLKAFFQSAGTTVGYSGPKCSPKCTEQEVY